MAEMDNIDHEKKLKITMYQDVKLVCQDTAKHIDLMIEKNATSLISELVWKKTKRIAEDLEDFAKHAKRTTVNADDVKLLVRHNEKLKEDITKMANEMKNQKKLKKDSKADTEVMDGE